jgi:protein O-mannosyl-transferase
MAHASEEDGRGTAFPRIPAFAGAVLVACATLVAYLPALRGGFLWDDDGHVTKPALRAVRGLWRIWLEPGATQQYYPVLHTAFWIEHRIWGDAPLGYHLANVLLHAAAAILFGRVLLRLLGDARAALLGSILFALHPVCVESVAWISEQKNTLSAVFYLSAALVYLGGREEGGRRAYWLASLLFALALLSKSVTATLPAALLVVLWWRNGSLSWREDVRPLAPWLAAGLAAGLFTSWVEHRYIIGPGSAEFGLGFTARCLLAGRVVWFYAGKLAWPAGLSFIYPKWRIDPGSPAQWIPPLALAAAFLVLARLARRRRAPLAAALVFAGTLFPALGFLDAYPFVFSYVADHFQYHASLAFFALAAGAWSGGPGWTARLRRVPFLPLVVAAALGVATWRQCREYSDPETLYRATISANPGSFLARNNLAKILRESGRIDEAVAQYREALGLHPDAEAHYNLGVALLSAGRQREAGAEFQAALGLRPDYPAAHINLARVLAGMGRFDEAAAHDQAALGLRPDPSQARLPDEAVLRANAAAAHGGLGNILAARGRLADAEQEYRAALDADPGDPAALNGLGAVLSRTGRRDEAARQLEAALRARPDFVEARVNLAILRAMAGRPEQAIPEFEAALRLRPGMATVHYNLGNALAQVGRKSDAAAHYREALRLRPDFPQARAALEQLGGR